MRGENLYLSAYSYSFFLQPPHARGKLNSAIRYFETYPSTPACAGKTARFNKLQHCRPFNPRMRGENPEDAHGKSVYFLQPPHARGKTRWARKACATTPFNPRMCGENTRAHWFVKQHLGCCFRSHRPTWLSTPCLTMFYVPLLPKPRLRLVLAENRRSPAFGEVKLALLY